MRWARCAPWLAARSANPTLPWNGIVGIGGFIALALGVVAVAAAQSATPPREAAAS